jgi:hypothetical protein
MDKEQVGILRESFFRAGHLTSWPFKRSGSIK